MRNNSPTPKKELKRSQIPNSAPSRASAPPTILIETQPGSFPLPGQHRAHLRNKRGYVYLCWREGRKVRSFYLGKAPRSCPTAAARSQLTAAAIADPPRRARITQKNRARLPQSAPLDSRPTRSTPEKGGNYAR